MSNEKTLQADLKKKDIPAPAYMLRAGKVFKMFQDQMKTLNANKIDEAALFSRGFDNDIFREYWQFQQAAFERVLDTRKSWFAGTSAIMREYRETKKVNTLSKFVEQECNIIGQWTALMTQQFTSWTEMMENIQIDYGYWLSQKKKQAKS